MMKSTKICSAIYDEKTEKKQSTILTFQPTYFDKVSNSSQQNQAKK